MIEVKKYDDRNEEIDQYGTKAWYLNGVRHRTDGPAIEWSDCDKEWWVNGERHRVDGPAIERSNGYRAWYLNGVEYNELEFKFWFPGILI